MRFVRCTYDATRTQHVIVAAGATRVRDIDSYTRVPFQRNVSRLYCSAVDQLTNIRLQKATLNH